MAEVEVSNCVACVLIDAPGVLGMVMTLDEIVFTSVRPLTLLGLLPNCN